MPARLHGAPPGARGTKTWIQPRRIFNAEIAESPFIQGHLQIMAESMAFKARNHLASHTDEGRARILLEKDGTDRLIILEDRQPDGDALAIEFGHWTRGSKSLNAWDGKSYVPGLNILGGLIGTDSSRARGKSRGRRR